MTSRPLLLLAAQLLAAPAVLRAQAALEYALTTGKSAVTSSGSGTVAGCAVNSEVFSCLGRAYPRATIAVAVVISLLVLRWLAGLAGYRRR